MNEKKKIPCSVSIITLNSGVGLAACLESLREFEEVIISDGNSTDNTQAIAHSLGARVIKQYDTDEPAVPCAMDKAAVRERAMNASTLPWRFFMDSDDPLTQDTIEEIRSITSVEHPKHLIWRLRSRVFVAGRLINYYGSYPAYQVRLVHKDVGAYFRGDVHERLVWDEDKYPVGTMQSFYDFHWPKERVDNYWGYWRTYINRELQTMKFGGFGNFLYWGVYRRMRTIVGYIFWRLPRMYILHGFKETMPLPLEMITVRYHLALLVRSITLYVKTRLWVVVLVETLRGKDLNRILCNVAVRGEEAYGRVLDIGGREGKSSYWRYLKKARWYRATTLDIDSASKPDVVVNIDEEPLPFAPNYFDTVLFFNTLEHVKNNEAVLKKINTVLRLSGTMIGVIPFLVGYHPDPHDYVRYTQEGLARSLKEAGFEHIQIRTVGRGPLVASYYQSEFLWPRILKLLVIPLVFLLDAIVLWLRPSLRNKFPLSYVFVAMRKVND